jgi:broad specificity phosphatase PhoE
MSGTRLLLIRHAEVESKFHRTFGGRLDMGLSDLGHEQARALARHLDRFRFDALYASPMRRVQLTLAPLLSNGHPQPFTEPNLREVDFGDWTGLVWEQVREKFGVSPYEWLAELQAGRMPNAETGPALCARVGGVVRGILERHDGQTIGVFCHGGVIRAALAHLLDLPLIKTHIFEVDYASVTEVEAKCGRAELQLLNFTPWRTA